MQIQLLRKNLSFLFLMLMGTMVMAQDTFLDTFSSVSYANNNGTQNFSGNWTESGDDNSASGGYIRITGNELRFSYIWTENIRRSANLSAYSSANLSFDWRTVSLESGETLAIQVSSDGSSYTTLTTFGGATSGTFSQDISAYMSANTTIRFLKGSNNWSGSNDQAFIDNLLISGVSTPRVNIDDVSVNENAGTMTFTVTHNGPSTSGAFTANYQTVDGTALAGTHYTSTTGTLSFNGTTGDTEQITVPIIDNTLFDGDKTFTVQFTSVSDGSVNIADVGTGTIVDDEVILSEVPLSLYNEFNGYYDYAVTGGSLRDQNNPVYCSIKATSTVNGLTSVIPPTGTVVQAYLLWSHSNQTPDTQVTFEGQTVNAELVYGASMSGGRLFYGMMSDVTSIIAGLPDPSTNVYDFTNLNIDNTDSVASYCTTGTVLGGWSLLVFYEESTLPAVSINMYHGFKGESNTSRSYTLDGFYAIGSTDAKTTVLSWEGDSTLNGSSAGTTNPNGEALTVTNQGGSTTILSGDGGQTGNNAYNSTIYNNTPSGIVNYNNSWGVDLDTFDISPYISAADSQITVNVHTGQDFVIANMVLVKVPSNLIVGNVFEDINYGGGAGRDMATSGGPGVGSTRVELFDGSGTLEEFTTTDAVGEYSFGGMANGNYSVRVVNGTISSTRGGGGSCATCYPVQTYRRDFTTGVGFANITNEVGGADPLSQDVGNSTLTNAQSVSSVSIASEGVVGLDFGFNFNTIVNTNDSGQGSLRQYIINSNALAETGMDIEANSIFDPIVGVDVSIFMIPPTGDPLGRTADPNFTSGYFDILQTSSNQLPIITDNDTRIDGRTQTAYSGNTNSGTVGSGGTTVGTSAAVLPNYDLPEIQVHRNSGDVFRIQGGGIVIRNISVYANINAGIWVDSGSATISNNLLGVNALGANAGNIISGIEQISGTVVIDGNYISTNTDHGIWINGGSSSLIQNNHITSNGSAACSDNITIQNGSGITIQQNLIENAASLGIDADGISGGITITENTITGSGQDGGNCSGNVENAGILLDGDNSNISNNVIASNGGAGIVLAGGNTSGNLISQNSIYANGTASDALGIDLDGSDNAGDGVTLNDNGDSDNGPNGLANFPIIITAYRQGNNLVVKGWARPGAIIELYLTDVNEGTATEGDNELGLSTDYGEGQVFLGTVIEGSGADLAVGTSSYNDVDGNTDNTNLFEFNMPVLSGISIGDYITATATIANSTSEFSPFSILKVQTVITNRRITYRVNRN